jgi:hypothetical protein
MSQTERSMLGWSTCAAISMVVFVMAIITGDDVIFYVSLAIAMVCALVLGAGLFARQ